MIRKYWLPLFCLLLTALVLTVGCAQPAPATSPAADQASAKTPPSLVITPNSGVAGAKLTIYGAGFVPGEKVRVTLNLGKTKMAMAAADSGGLVVANAYGAFALSPASGGIPGSAVITPGVYTVEASGDKGSQITAPLEVLKPPEKK
ncbi:MAG: hypothetical protein Q7R57_00210 [Dehalococcoidales bacterium]|nr:hypothetical protein [Dehalococcoidales bacterium]